MPKLYTIGHSTRPLKEFFEILHSQKITHIVDVRTIPKSNHVPWFNKDNLELQLPKAHIAYIHMSILGGLRKANKDSINQGWRNTSFRGYADYMQTPQFYEGLKQLNKLLKARRKVAIMCAEAVPWRCHRSLLSDAELVRGIRVIDIMSRNSLRPHKLTSFAIIDRTKRPIKTYYPKV